ncbi:MAG: YCF48-related protein [Chloroflexota bacterium]
MHRNRLLFVMLSVFLSLGSVAFLPTGQFEKSRTSIEDNHLPGVQGVTVLSPTISIPTLSDTIRIQPLSDHPKLVKRIDFGIPIGNGLRPVQMQLDADRRLLYTLNYGSPEADQGNTISVYDLEKSQFITLIQLKNQQGEFPPQPRTLTLDPYRNYLYAVSDESGQFQLTVVDLTTFKPIVSLPEVGGVAVTEDNLYLVNQDQIRSVDPEDWTVQGQVSLAYQPFNIAFYADSENDRLHLIRSTPWVVETYEASSLTLLSGYTTQNEIIQASLGSVSGNLMLMERSRIGVDLQMLDKDGQSSPNLVDLPLNTPFGGLPLDTVQDTLYVIDSKGQDETEILYFSMLGWRPLGRIKIPDFPEALQVDPQTNKAYVLYPQNTILTVDLLSEEIDVIYTARTIATALADVATNRLYVLSEQDILHILQLDSHAKIAQIALLPQQQSPAEPSLSFDAARNRLYISGAPIHIIDTDSLTLLDTAPSSLAGHITPDPTSNKVYHTPPCQCQLEQCNTIIRDADSWDELGQVFPTETALVAPCVVRTQLDAENQLLYAHIHNGTPGSNGGTYFSLFDVSGPPAPLYTSNDISNGLIAFDATAPHVFVPRQRMGLTSIERYQYQDNVFTATQVFVGRQGALIFDAASNRLYSQRDAVLQTFDSGLSLLSEVRLPSRATLLDIDPNQAQLYLKNFNGQLLVMDTQGGKIARPSLPDDIENTVFPVKRFVTSDGLHFRILDQRLYRSLDEGQTWQILGWGLPDYPVNDLAISPTFVDDGLLLASLSFADEHGGLYQSQDRGTTWKLVMKGITDMGVTGVRFSPTFNLDQTIFILTNRQGLYRSTDAGQTWQNLSTDDGLPYPANPPTFVALSPDFVNDGLVFVSQGTLLRSNDGGETWVNTELSAQSVTFSPDFKNDGLILSDGRWRSLDQGRRWEASAQGLAATPNGTVSLHYSPKFVQDQMVYAVIDQGYGSELLIQRSADAGLTWDTLLTPLPDFPLAAILPLPEEQLLLIGKRGQEQALTLDTLAWGQPTIDVGEIALQALVVTSDDTLFVGNSAAGIFKSTDDGQQWAETGFPIRGNELDPVQLTKTPDDILFAGLGSVLARSDDQGESWEQYDFPAGFSVASLAVSPDFSADSTLLAGGMSPQNDLIYSGDGGQSWQTVFEGRTIDTGAIAKITMSPNFNLDGLVVAWMQNGGLIQSTDWGLTWQHIVDDVTRYSTAQSLAFDPDGYGLYLGTLDGHVYFSDDGGQTWWFDIAEGIAESRVWSSAIAFDDDGTLYLGTDIGVFRTEDAGGTWLNISNGLPSRNASTGEPQAVQSLYYRDGRLYLALAEGGVYFSDDRGQTWQNTASASE